MIVPIASPEKRCVTWAILIVVEHDEDTMREADYLIDVGPGAGVFGGEIVGGRNAPNRLLATVSLLQASTCQANVPSQYQTKATCWKWSFY